jgi:hypothetical protein
MADFTTAGNYEPGAEIYSLKKHTTAITKGDLLTVDGTSKGYKTAPIAAGTLGPFGVATKTQVASDGTAAVGKRGIFYLIADGAIDPNDFVMPSTTTAGRVIKFVASTVSGTPTQAEVIAAAADARRIVGQYMGKLDQNEGSAAITAAAQGDVVRVLIHGGN